MGFWWFLPWRMCNKGREGKGKAMVCRGHASHQDSLVRSEDYTDSRKTFWWKRSVVYIHCKEANEESARKPRCSGYSTRMHWWWEDALMMRSRVKSTKNKYLGSGERDKMGRRKGSAFFERDIGDRCWSSAEQLKLAKTSISINMSDSIN